MRILNIPFFGRFALVPDRNGAATGFPGGLKWNTNLRATHLRNGVVLREYDLGSGVVTNDGVLDLAQDWNPVTFGTKAAPTFGANAASGGHMSNGTYNYRVTALTATGESAGTSAPVTLAAGGALQTQIVNWSATANAIGYKVYRSIAGGAAGSEKWVGTVTSGATVTFTDTVSDATEATGYAVPTTDTTFYSTLRASNWHDSGTGTNAESVTDHNLQVTNTAVGRAQGTQSNPGSGQYKTIGIITYNSSLSITEWGLFTLNRALGDTQVIQPTLWDRRKFASIGVTSGDSIQFTYTLTINSGG